MKKAARFALFSTVGFGIGGLFPGLAAFLAFAFAFQRGGQGILWFIVLLFLFSGFYAKGAFGGTALSLALKSRQESIKFLTLFSGIGFTIGGLLRFFLPAVFPEAGGYFYPEVSFSTFLLDGLEGGIGSTALGIGFRDKRKIVGLALAGFLGFGIGWWIANSFGSQYDWWLQIIIRFTLSGIIGGAALGVTLGYLDRE
jgi:hypothetical protein